MSQTPHLPRLALALLGAAAAAHTAGAQPRDPSRARTVSLLAGTLRYDRGDDRSFPLAAARVSWRLSPLLLGEMDLSYAARGGGGAALRSASAACLCADSGATRLQLVAVTVGVHAELPLPSARPYAGIAAGLFGRFGPPGEDRFVRPVTAFPLGVRVPVSRRLGARGEVRLRFDEHQDGGASVDAEATVGLTLRF